MGYGWLNSPWAFVPQPPQLPGPRQPRGNHDASCSWCNSPWALVPQLPQLSGPMQPGGRDDAACGWLVSPRALTLQPLEPPELFQPPYWQAASPLLNRSPWPRCRLSWRFPLRPGETPTMPVRRLGRGHQSPNQQSLCKADPGEPRVEGGASSPSPATSPHWLAAPLQIKRQPPKHRLCRPLQSKVERELEESDEGEDPPSSTDTR